MVHKKTRQGAGLGTRARGEASARSTKAKATLSPVFGLIKKPQDLHAPDEFVQFSSLIANVNIEGRIAVSCIKSSYEESEGPDMFVKTLRVQFVSSTKHRFRRLSAFTN